MKNHKLTMAVILGLCAAAPTLAQTKPPESATRVKKVLRFYKVGPGEYIHTDGQRDLEATLKTLSTSKGFELVHSNNDAQLTASYLSQFQVIVWDNNVNAGTSVGSVASREAVINYVNGGGGWLLVHGAGDHKDSWEAFKNAMQTKFSSHGAQGAADFVLDPEGLAHKELKWMMSGWATTTRFTRDEWYSFQNTVRGRQNIVIVATAKNGASGVLNPMGDNSGDHTYVFAREMGKGRVMYTALGHGGNSFYTQANGFAVTALYENMRYVAGDYKNGCTNKNASNYDSLARIDDGTCSPTGIGGVKEATKADITVMGKGFKTKLNFPHESKYTVELRDMRGALVWSEVLVNTSEINLDGKVRPGMYQLVARAGKNVLRHRLNVL